MSNAYIDALKMLGRRELSEKQVRQRLARRAYGEEAINEALARLKEEQALDDARVAGAIARSGTSTKRHGRVRVARDIQNAGISRAAAKKAVDETFAEIDEDSLIAATLSRRLHGREGALDQPTLARLYRYLRGQGFEHERVLKHLARLKRTVPSDPDA